MTSSVTPACTSLITSAKPGEALMSAGAAGVWTTLTGGVWSEVAFVLSRTATRLLGSGAAGVTAAAANTGTSACAFSSWHPTHNNMLPTATASDDTRNN